MGVPSRIAATLLFAIVVAGSCRPAEADVIYSTFGPGDSYNHAAGWVVGFAPGPAGAGPYWFQIGASFTPTDSFITTSIDLAAVQTRTSTGPDDLLVQLWTGTLPGIGASLAQFAFDPALIPTPPSAVYTAPLAGVLLTAGTQYWVVLSVANLGTTQNAYAWMLNSQGIQGLAAARLDNWFLQEDSTPAFRVNGTPAPEPAGTALVALGLAAAGFARRRRR
jgi:hypothetical protein